MEVKFDLSLDKSPMQQYKSSKSNDFSSSFKRKTHFALTGKISKNKHLDQAFPKSTKRLKTNRPMMQRSSVVYQLPNTGDTRYKDYDKISGDIKKLEMSIRKEKELYWRKTSSKIIANEGLDAIESNSSEDEENDKNKYIEKFNILEVIQKFKILPENRTVEDLYVTKNFLHQTKLIEHFNKEFNKDKRMVENLATFFGLEFRYQKFKKGESIYKIDDYADNFYMVLLGKVDLLKVEPKIVNITGYEYFCYIMNLKKKNEMHRYKLCVEENKDIFPISSDEEDLLPYFFLQFILEDIKEGKRINFGKMLDIIDFTPKDIGLAENRVYSNEYLLEKEKRIIKKIANFSKDKIKEYRFINNKIVKRNLIIYEYVKNKTIEALSFFGDECIETGSPRKETAVCAENTELIYIMNRLYINNIMPKKTISLERRTAFLGKNYLFNKITPKKFVRRYFNLFTLETYMKGDILFNENDDLEYVYFIKEGNVNLFTSKSILEMEMFINEINKKIKVVQNIFNNESNNEDEKNFNSLYNNIKSSSTELFDYIKKREKINVFILKESEDAGLISYLLGIGYLVSGVVESPESLIYKIKKDDLTEILTKEKLCFYELINRVENKLKVFSKRFYEINNIKLSMTDQKISEENNMKYNISNKNTINKIGFNDDVFPKKNEAKANVDKIKEIINIHETNKMINNKRNTKNKNIVLTLPSLFNKFITRNSISSLSPKKSKDIVLVKNIKTIFFNYKHNITNSSTSSNTNNKSKKIKSFFPTEEKKNKLTYKERFKKLLYYRKRFPYEDEFFAKLKEDMDNLVENKLILTKKTKSIDTDDISTYRDNNNLENTGNEEAYKTNNTNINRLSGHKNNLFLITQIENYKNDIRANHIFTQTDNKFKIKKNRNNITKKLLNKINKEKLLFNTELQRINTINNNYSTNTNFLYNEKINSSINKKNIIRNIKHPYVSPLTMVKLRRYKMIDDKDKFEENKKRYEKNVVKKYKEKGLNEFGFPISYDKYLSIKFNYEKNKF